MARIVHSPAAEDDLLEIWVGLAANNVSAAERLMDDLDAATQTSGNPTTDRESSS